MLNKKKGHIQVVHGITQREGPKLARGKMTPLRLGGGGGGRGFCKLAKPRGSMSSLEWLTVFKHIDRLVQGQKRCLCQAKKREAKL